MHWFLSTIVIAFGVSGVAYAGPLFDAASRGDLGVVKKFLDDRVEVDERGRYGETPLMAAALAGEAATAELLIAHGADVMARNEGGLTPLHAAAYSGSNEVAQSRHPLARRQRSNRGPQLAQRPLQVHRGRPGGAQLGVSLLQRHV